MALGRPQECSVNPSTVSMVTYALPEPSRARSLSVQPELSGQVLGSCVVFQLPLRAIVNQHGNVLRLVIVARPAGGVGEVMYLALGSRAAAFNVGVVVVKSFLTRR